MAKQINIIANLIDKHLRKQVKDIENAKYSINVDVKGDKVKETRQNMLQLGSAVTSTNTAFGKLKNTISNTFSSARITMTAFLTILNEINKAGKNAKQTIEDMDSAITDLSIATNKSRESTAGLVKDYNEYAKELKSTTTQITSAADDYLRAGKTMNEAKELIEDSIMLSKLGQIDSSEATEDLLATMNGYEMSIEQVHRALDAMVAIDMEAATSAGDLATGLKYSASSASSAELSFNKLVAILGTVQDKTQQSAEVVGTFANTMLSRYRDITIGKYISDDGEDISNYESVLKSVGIALRDEEGEFRAFEIVLQEMADKWETLSSVQQNTLIKVAAGTRQQNRFIALMEGYNKVLELTEVAANSAGTAVEKFNNSYVDSLEAKKNTLKASFESMVINSDMDEVYSGIVEATTALVEFINQTNALKGVTTGLTVSGVIKGFLALKTGINDSYITLNKFSNALKIVKQTKISNGDLNRLLLLTNGLSDSQMKMVLSSKSLSVSQKELLLVNSGLSKEEAKLQLQTWGLTTAQTGLSVATTTLGNAFKGLWATLLANPFAVLTMAVSGAVMAYQSYNQKLEETRQKNIEASETAIDHANSLKDLYTEYSRLSAIQDRSSAEEESFKTVIEDVTKALGDKAKVLEGLTAGTNEYADALANATREELQSESVNATIGRKSAEEELQADIWSAWSGSKVSVDSNSTGQSLSEEAQRAVDIVSDVLKDFETVNKTWNNLSWDITSDSPEEALEYYNSLLKAREALVLASENDEALLDTEIYKDMNTAISAMEDSLDSYISKRYEEEKLIYMATNGIPQTTEEYKAMQDSLIATASASADLQDKFKSLLMADFSSLANEIEGVSEAQSELEDSMPDGEKIISTITTSIKQIATQLEPQFVKLGEAYQNIFTADGFTLDNVDNSMLEELRQSFAEIEEEVGVAFDTTQLNDFFDALTNGDSTAEQVQQSFNDLATSYFYSTNTLEQLNETTADSIAKQLEELGVINAKEVVYDALSVKTEALALQEQFLAENGYALADATITKVNGFLNEAGASEIARQYLFQLVATEQIFNNQDLNAKQKIDELQKLAIAYGQTAIAAKIANMEEGAKAGHSTIDYDVALQELQTHINEGMNQVKVDFSGIKTNASDAGKKAGEEYLDGLKDKLSDLDNVLGYINDIIQDQIDLLGEQKDAAISALETEKEKAEEALEAEKELVQAKIDGLQDEIDKIEEAREKRKADIALQKAQFELERMQNQKTDLIYKGGQMVYETDVTGIRDARESVDEAKENIKILQIEKEISGLEDIIDSLDKQIEESNNYYDNLIAQTELYWDSLIKGMEEYQDRWAQIGELEEQAKIQVALKELGIETDDILNMSGEAFEQFKQKYLDILVEMYSGNDAMITSLKDVAGSADFSILDESMLKAKDSISQLGDSATNALTPIKDTASAVGEIGTNSEGVSEDINSINTALDTLSGDNKLQGITNAFQTLLDKIDEVAKALGTTTEQMESGTGLIGAIQALSEAQIGTELLTQFTELESAIGAVTTAINGGGEGQTAGNGDPLSGGSKKDVASSGGTGGLTQAIEEQVNKAKELLPEEINLFGADEESLLSAVTKVTTAIAGGGDSEGGKKKEQSGQREGEADTSHLMGALDAQYKEAEIKIPQERDWFNELATAIELCVTHLTKMSELLQGLTTGDLQFGLVNFHSQGTVGKAFAKGTGKYKGLPSSEKNTLRSEYGQPELTVYPDGTTELTTEPTMSDLPKDTVIFNEEQTRRIIKNKGTVLGNAHSEGTITLSNGTILQPANLGYDVDALVQSLKNNMDYIINPLSSIDKNVDTIMRTTNNISNHNTMQNVTNFSTGDIIVQGVQDVDGLAHAIKTRFPNAMIQAMSVTR